MSKFPKTLKIKEQTIWRDACGLTFEFLVSEDATHPYVMRIYGESLPYGNREITFGKDGKMNGGGTGLVCPSKTILPD